jgi:carnitine 3-dehydrogenase
MPIHTVAILGTGLIGASWATFYASKGLDVRLFDAHADACEQGVKQIEKNLRHMQQLGVIANADDALARVQRCDSLELLLDGVPFVQESVIENYEIKDALYREMEPHAPVDTIIASSSSGLLISQMQKSLQHPDRALIAHPFNPPHLIPLVELVPGDATSEDTVARAKEFYTGLGKKPVVLNKEVPGHIANRLAAAVWRESLALLDDGVASAQDIDNALTFGPGLRWALMGQHLIYELGGGDDGYEKFLDIFGNAFSEYWKDMEDWTRIPDSAKAKAIDGVQDYFNDRSKADWINWRDEKLVALLKSVHED